MEIDILNGTIQLNLEKVNRENIIQTLKSTAKHKKTLHSVCIHSVRIADTSGAACPSIQFSQFSVSKQFFFRFVFYLFFLEK